MNTIENTLPTIETVNLNDSLFDVGRLASDVSTAESFAVTAKDQLNDALYSMRDAGVNISGDLRNNPSRKALRDGIAKGGLSDSRVRDILSFVTQYYETATAVTTLRNSEAVKDSIAKQLAIRAGTGETVPETATKRRTGTTKSPVEKAKEKADKLQAVYTEKLSKDSIEITIDSLSLHPEFYYLVNFIVENGTVNGFAESMRAVRIEKEKNRAELLAQIAELQAKL